MKKVSTLIGFNYVPNFVPRTATDIISFKLVILQLSHEFGSLEYDPKVCSGVAGQ